MNTAASARAKTNTLAVSGFRGFQNLELSNLGQVNLLTGTNGAGKSTLLDALSVIASTADLGVLWQILKDRKEDGRFFGPQADRSLENFPLLNLWNRKTDIETPIEIRTDSQNLKVEFRQHRIGKYGSGPITPESIAEDLKELRSTQPRHILLDVENAISGEDLFSAILEMKEQPPQRVGHAQGRVRRNSCEIPYVMLSATGLREHETELLWDSLALTEAEEDTISCLRYVVPTLDRVALAASTLGGARPVLARLRDSHSPVPLSSFGGGAVRVFEMAASLAKAQNGFLLIDEFENGLHYSIQPKLWEFLFRSARRLNVQVFATTHSSDTISAFFAAAESVPDVDGVLTTLYEKNGEIHAARLDERDLGVALRANMEVR